MLLRWSVAPGCWQQAAQGRGCQLKGCVILQHVPILVPRIAHRLCEHVFPAQCSLKGERPVPAADPFPNSLQPVPALQGPCPPLPCQSTLQRMLDAFSWKNCCCSYYYLLMIISEHRIAEIKIQRSLGEITACSIYIISKWCAHKGGVGREGDLTRATKTGLLI